MENKEQNIEIVLFDDEEQLSDRQMSNRYKESQAKQSRPISSQNEASNFDEEIHLQEKAPHRAKDMERRMSKEEYSEKCLELQKRIVFNNVSNSKHNVEIQQRNFISQLKEKRRESQNNFRKSSLMSIQDIIQIPKINDVKVDFVEKEPVVAKKSRASNFFCLPMNLQCSMSEELEPSKKEKTIGLDGAVMEQEKDLQIEQLKDKNMLKVSNFRQFLYVRLKPCYQIFLKIKRTQSGLINSTYKFYFQQNSRFVLSCQKQGFSKYVFSSSEVHISEDHISYLGRMETTFMGTQFWMYDSGEDCTKTKMMQNYKKQLAYIAYSQEPNQPRKFDAYITTCDNRSTDFTITDSQTNNVLFDRWKNNNKHVEKLTTKEPNYDPNDCNYKLDFRGLAGIPSIKNFIVQNEQFEDSIIFGRHDKDSYLVRVKAPFSILQAAALCMSSIHYKFL